MLFLDKEIQNDVIKILKEVAESDSIVQVWENRTYGDIQRITNPKKGDFGEKIVSDWLSKFGYVNKFVGRQRQRGGNNTDLLVTLKDNTSPERVEVKLASLDSKRKYQFNWIPVNYNYAFIIFLGITPTTIQLSLKTKKDIKDYIDNPRRGKTLTPVPTRENPTHRKWTTTAEHADMVTVWTYRDIKNVFDRAISRFLELK